MSRKYDPAIEWVPVRSGQMPEEKSVVLITNSEGDVIDACFDGYRWRGAGISVGYWGDGDAWYGSQNDVVAWRNLPEPYRGDESK